MKGKFRFIIAGGIIIFALFKFFSSADTNEHTGEKQYIGLSIDQEIALGLQSSPTMIGEYGGLHPDQQLQNKVDEVGSLLVTSSIARDTDYKYEFHLLADAKTINAFALPGGPCFITYALFSQLENDDQLAGILGHEIGHVIARHSAARISQQDLTNGVLSGVAVGSGSEGATQLAQVIAQTVNMKYGRDDELQSDDLGVKMMMDAGYDPYQMIKVMEILKAAAGPNRAPEFQSTHPDPENRIDKIKASIEKYKQTG